METLARIAETSAVASAAIDVTPFTVWTEEARASLPQWVQTWIIFMLVALLSGLIFAKDHVAARWVVGAVVVSHLASAFFLFVLGPETLKVGIIAINHVVFWTPAAIFLALRGAPKTKAILYSCWRYVALLVLIFSLIFDFRDAAIFILGSTGVASA